MSGKKKKRLHKKLKMVALVFSIIQAIVSIVVTIASLFK